LDEKSNNRNIPRGLERVVSRYSLLTHLYFHPRLRPPNSCGHSSTWAAVLFLGYNKQIEERAIVQECENIAGKQAGEQETVILTPWGNFLTFLASFQLSPIAFELGRWNTLLVFLYFQSDLDLRVIILSWSLR